MKRTLLLLAAAACLLAGAGPAPDAPTADQLERELRRAIAVRGDGRHNEALAALRQLRDPRLEPLFAQLATSPTVALRRQGILGLAELSKERSINLMMVADVRDPLQRVALVADALNADLIADDQLERILALPDLDASLEVLIRARMAAKGRGADPARLDALEAIRDRPAVGVLAGLSAAQAGKPAGADRAWKRLGELKADERAAVTEIVVQGITREKLTKSGPFLAKLIPTLKDDRAAEARAVAALIRIDPAAGAKAWNEAFARADGVAARIRLALVAVDDVRSITPAIAGRLAKDKEPLIADLGRAAAEIAGKKDPTANLLAVVDHRQELATAWALGTAPDLPKAHATAFLMKLVERAESRPDRRSAVPRTVFEAALRLARIDPRSLEGPLARARSASDLSMCEALLDALLAADARAPLWEVSTEPGWPGPSARALAVLLEARSGAAWFAAPGKFPDRAATLRNAALGWGGLPPVYRTQASWLALVMDGQDRQALARLLAPEPD
ncbi:MAG: hypothetical protein IBJ11_03270 [Phycisphaerales bacterium]|nr:hypothetical protein [Phycisphaerales bacterium]